MLNKIPLMEVPFVDLSAQYENLETEINQAIAGVLKRTDFILGKDVERFEQEFADYCGVQYGIGLDSGLSALELILRAYGIGPGDEVITQANTFIATVLAISSVGAKPVLVDIDPESYMIDIEQLRSAITSRTKAIMPVYLYGCVADMDPIMALAHRHGLVVIEDASQAHGAKYGGVRAGALGHAAAFSLYPSKNLGAYGDAGIVVTNDTAVVEKIKLLRNYGSVKKYFHEVVGYNRRLDTLHAAILRVKLRHLDAGNADRRRHAHRYGELLKRLPIVCPNYPADVEPVHHLYVIRTPLRDELQAYLRTKGIASGIHYPLPVHLQPAYPHLGYRVGEFPITETFAQDILSLPMYPELSESAIDYVADAIHEFMEINGAIDWAATQVQGKDLAATLV